MILLDFSQIAISNASILRIMHSGELPLELLRFQILNSIRMYNVKFSHTFGEMIICCDGNKYWRKERFKFYKSEREKTKDDATIDMFVKMDTIRDELRDLFPYKVLRFDALEADDVIAILSRNIERHTIIISADKDFQQLQSLSHIKQYSPLKKEFIKCESPNLFLKELIIRGDKGDGIPNILSDDNYLADRIRQPSIRRTDLDTWLYSRPEDFCQTNKILENYYRNKMLIAFSEIPETFRDLVLERNAQMTLNTQSNSILRAKMELYFRTHKLDVLASKIEDFFE